MEEQNSQAFNLENMAGLDTWLMNNARERYRVITANLAKCVMDFESEINKQNLLKEELQIIRTRLLKNTKIIREAMNRTKLPDLVSVLSEFEVVKSSGERFIANEGLEEKLHSHYKNTISALEDMLKIVDDNIQNFKFVTPTIIDKSGKKPSYLGYALFHYYWAKFSKDRSKAITKINVEELSRTYGMKRGQLLKYAERIEDEAKHSEHYNSIKAFAEQYELIIPMLKKVCEPAANEVEKMLMRLKKSYSSFFIKK